MPNSYRYISNSNSYQYISKNAKIDINISSEVHERSIKVFEKFPYWYWYWLVVDIFSNFLISTSIFIFSETFF